MLSGQRVPISSVAKLHKAPEVGHNEHTKKSDDQVGRDYTNPSLIDLVLLFVFSHQIRQVKASTSSCVTIHRHTSPGPSNTSWQICGISENMPRSSGESNGGHYSIGLPSISLIK